MKSLWEELIQYGESDYYPFHMPGHKRLPEEDALPPHKSFLSPLYKCDITEIEGFDNLHDAGGLLLSLQQKSAGVYHAEQSFFLINGSTCGILSAVSSIARDDKKILVARNCHKSVYNAIRINRLQAEYLWPGRIEDFDIQGEITAEQIEKHLSGREDICGVVVTSPTYDGIVSDICEIAKVVHGHGIPLVVDEAHGAHFVLSKKAPRSAVECGADIVINSVHKTLPSLTQTGLLHVQGSIIDRERLRDCLSVYQSSSPSYLLMASIDRCIDFIREQGPERYDRLLDLRARIDERAKRLSCIRIMPAGERRDPGKLVLSVNGTEMTGQELYRTLYDKYHLQMEMGAPSYALGILTVMDAKEGVERLLDALENIDGRLSVSSEGNEKEKDIYCGRPAASGLSIYEALCREREWIRPEEAAGRISGGFLYFYPPGIPVLVPGEIIDGELVRKMKRIRKRKEYLTGISREGKICVLKKA